MKPAKVPPSFSHTQILHKVILNRTPSLRGESPEANGLPGESYGHVALKKKNPPRSRILLEKLTIIIIFIYCSWVVTRWQCYFTRIQNMKLVTTAFKSGGLHEKHVVATWNLGNHLSICL